MNEEPNSENITPKELIDSLLNNIEVCKETLEMCKAVPENTSRSLKVLKKFEKALNHKGFWPFLLIKNLLMLSDRCSGRLISGHQRFPAFSMQKVSLFSTR
jgi:hypothetical protein